VVLRVEVCGPSGGTCRSDQTPWAVIRPALRSWPCDMGRPNVERLRRPENLTRAICLKIGTKIVRPGRDVVFKTAEVVVPQDLMADSPRVIALLGQRPAPA